MNQQTQISSNRSSLNPKQQIKVFEKVPAKRRNLSFKKNSSIKIDEILHEDATRLGIYKEVPENQRSPEFAPNQSGLGEDYSTLERIPVVHDEYVNGDLSSVEAS